MMDRMWDLWVDTLMTLFLPLVCSYFVFSANVFLTVSVQNPTRMEQLANTLLAPVQFVLAGKEAIEEGDGNWRFVQKFDYKRGFWIKTAFSAISLPPSLILGSAVKGLSLLDPSTRRRFHSLVASQKSKAVRPHFELYRTLGIQWGQPVESLSSLGFGRRPGDEQLLKEEKRALFEIGKVLTEAGIPWWVDCGTCLGAYRYGGVIPWDVDIDIGVLLPDFQNVRHALNRLDPAEYAIQDWSSREHPDSYLKVYLRKTGTLVDIYHFAIDPELRQIRYVFALENNMFFPEWWKIRERRFKAPVSFETVFPLKKGQFDGIEVFVPNDTKKYLQRYYGENLDPVKIYNPESGLYEKDLSHPYWQKAYVK